MPMIVKSMLKLSKSAANSAVLSMPSAYTCLAPMVFLRISSDAMANEKNKTTPIKIINKKPLPYLKALPRPLPALGKSVAKLSSPETRFVFSLKSTMKLSVFGIFDISEIRHKLQETNYKQYSIFNMMQILFFEY